MAESDNTMIRTQIQLTTAQHEALKRLAARRGVSMAHVVREGVDAMLSWGGKDPWDDLLSVVGKYGEGAPCENVGQDHDRYLEEIYGEWERSS